MGFLSGEKTCYVIVDAVVWKIRRVAPDAVIVLYPEKNNQVELNVLIVQRGIAINKCIIWRSQRNAMK